MAAVALATCAAYPEPSTDAPLREALAARGHAVFSAPWNGDQEPFECADLVVLRACWDYHENPSAFLSWLDALEAGGVRLLNDYGVVRWNFDKRYLAALHAAGVPCVPTIEVDAQNEAEARARMRALGWRRAVRKPVHGQSGHGVELLSIDEPWSAANFEGAALLQPFQEDICESGETLLVFVEGRFSHAIRRELPKGEWRSNSRFGARRIAVDVSDAVIRSGVEILERGLAVAGTFADVDEVPLYARVDGLVRDDALVLMELELIEPALGFEVAPEGASRLARAICDRMAGR